MFNFKSFLLVVLLSVSVNTTSAETANLAAGTFKVLSGSVKTLRNNVLHDVNMGDSVFIGDHIITGASSFAGVTLFDNTRLTAGPNSDLVIDAFSFSTTTHKGELNARIGKGSLAVISGQLAKSNPEKVVFNTNTMTVGVRGTEFIIEANEE